MIVQLTLLSDPTTPKEFTFTLKPNGTIAIGRDPSNSSGTQNFINLDSKVVSRMHASITSDQLGKVFLQDMKSSSGSFLNSMRLSPPKVQSQLLEIKDGDYLQLGEDCVVNGTQFKSVLFRLQIAPADDGVKERDVGPRASIVSEGPSKGEIEFNDIWDNLNRDLEDNDPLVFELLNEVSVMIRA